MKRREQIICKTSYFIALINCIAMTSSLWASEKEMIKNKNYDGLINYYKEEVDKINGSVGKKGVFGKKKALSDEDKKKIINWYDNQAINYHKQGKYKEAINKMIEIIELQETLKDKEKAKSMASLYSELAMLYENVENYDQQIESLKKVIELVHNKKYEKKCVILIFESYLMMGKVYQSLGRNQEAIDAYKNSVVMGEKYNGELSMVNRGHAAYELGKLSLCSGALEEAAEYSKKAWKLFKNEKGEKYLETGIAAALYASVLFKKGDIEKAVKYQRKNFSALQINHGMYDARTEKSQEVLNYMIQTKMNIEKEAVIKEEPEDSGKEKTVTVEKEPSMGNEDNESSSSKNDSNNPPPKYWQSAITGTLVGLGSIITLKKFRKKKEDGKKNREPSVKRKKILKTKLATP